VQKLQEAENKPNKQTRNDSPPQQQRVAPNRMLGLELSALSDELRRRYKFKEGLKGLIVTAVDPGSSAAEQNIEAGLIVVEVSGEPVGSTAELQKRVEVLKKAGKRSALLLLMNAGGEQRFVAVAIP